MEDPKEASEMLSRIYDTFDKASAPFRSLGPKRDTRYGLSCMQQKLSPLAINGSLYYSHPLTVDGKETVVTEHFSIETVVETIAE